MIHVFIASPYGDHNDLATRKANVEASMALWHRLADAGFAPFCPLLSHFLHEYSPRPRAHWLAQSLAWVERCDCILAIGESSEGMAREILRARIESKPVFLSVEALGAAYGMEIS